MADQRITQLVELSQVAVSQNDVLPISDISASETKKITVKNLVAAGIDLVNDGEIDISKLDQNSTVKIDTVAIADNAITAAKLADNSSLVSSSIQPSSDNFIGRGFFNSSTGNLAFFNGTSYQQVVMPTAGIGDLQVTTGKLAAGAVTTEKVTALGTAAYADESITTAKLANQSVTAAKIAPDSITASQIAPNAIGSSELADAAVDTTAIQDSAVTHSKIADGAIINSKIADGAITNIKIAASEITYDKLNLAAGSVPGSKIADDSITFSQLAPGAVETTILADSSVTTAKLADFSVTTAKIENSSITVDKLALSSVTSAQLSIGAVITASIADLAVTNVKLANASVTSAKIANGAITTGAIADGAVTASKLDLAANSISGSSIATASITADQLAANSVGTSELVNLAVTTDKLADLSVTTAKIATSSIDSSKLASFAVTTAAIADSVVTYQKIQATSGSDVLIGRSSPLGGTLEEIPCTAAGRALLADATPSEQRETLELGSLALAEGTWVNGSSFSGTSSGTNTGDQTITLTGPVTGSGTGTFATSIAIDAINSSNIVTGAVTSAKIADFAVTQTKLSDNSSVIVNNAAPVGSGAFIGQHWLNTTSAIEYTWTGSIWLQQSGITSIGIVDSTPIALTVTYPDPYTATLTTTLDTQGAGLVWAGPLSGTDAAPTFRALEGSDLPLATASVVGAVKPGGGLQMGAAVDGTIEHVNSVTGATVSGITFDAHGHISAAVPLVASDIPGLDASKIESGSISIDRIGNKSITSAKLADYATAQLGETLPTPNFIGEIFLNPLDKTFFMWDGNVWVPIGISAGQVVFAGTYDASTNLVASVTSDGAAIGLEVGLALPLATTFNSSYYVVVSEGGTGVSPAPAVTLAPPDILLSNGANWVEVDVSSTYVAQSADNVSFTPAANLGSTNVQNALEEVSNECRNAANITSGTLAVARGGTGLTTYMKGEILAGNASNTLSVVSPGTNGQMLVADSATASGLNWAVPTTGTVTSVSSSTAALTVTSPTTTPALAIRSATTSVNGIVQLSDSFSTTSSTLAATPTAVKAAYDIGAAALPRAGGLLTGDLHLGQNVAIVYEGTTDDAFESRIYVADPTADREIFFPDAGGTLALTSQLDDGVF